MKTYTFTVTVEEGQDEFWEELRKLEATGCDEVLDMMRQAIDEANFNYRIVLAKYEDS